MKTNFKKYRQTRATIFFIAALLFSFTAFKGNGQSTAKSIILEEGFEEGLPSAWSFYQYGYGGIDDWRLDGYSYTGTKSIYTRANINADPDGWMVTPQITVSNSDFYLSFWEATHSFYYYFSHEVIISTGSGDPADGDFTDVIYTIPDDGYEFYSEVVLQLDDYVGEDIFIAFRYQNPNTQWGDNWHIDDVMVVETDLEHDLACVKMNPVYHASLETPCNPEVTVKNFGYSIESTYSVNLTIDGTAYNEIVEVTADLAILEENTIVFPDWVPEESGEYILNATVVLSNDQNPDNDGFSINCETFSPSDYLDGTVYSMEYNPNKDPLDKSISLNTETGEKVYLEDHDFNITHKLAALTYMDGKIIGVKRELNDVYVMTPTGKFIRIGNIPNVFYINGLAYDKVSGTLYAVGLVDDWVDDVLYTIDENWHATELFGMPQKPFIFGLAANSQGELYGISTMDGSLFTIDPDTQQTEDIGVIDGLQFSIQIQDIGFDRVNDILYGTLAVDDGQIFTKISTDDASLDILGNYGFDSSFGACAPISDLSTIIVSQKYGDINVYPNPSNGIFNLGGSLIDDDNDIIVEIINVSGEVVYSSKILSGFKSEIKVDISNQNDGVYILKYFSGDKYHFRKIIKK